MHLSVLPMDALPSLLPVAVAFLLDWTLREPPLRAHPVVWCGAWLRLARRFLPSRPLPAFLGGAAAWLAGAALSVGLGWGIQRLAADGPLPLRLAGLAASAWLVWGCFSLRMLLDEVAAVESALAVSLDAGRERVGRLVSRSTAGLTADEVRMAALETLSENLSDSVVSPLFWLCVAGLPGLALQRFANTADASWGYRGEWEWKGKWAARADDLLNWIPARLTAILLAGGRVPLRSLRAEASRTESPNAGWPMGAFALVLRTRLEKTGHYALNAEAPFPDAAVFARGLVLARGAGLAALGLALVVLGLRGALP